MMAKEMKTNAMRMLERGKINYQAHIYSHDEQFMDGVSVAQAMGENPDCVFKTLVTRSGPSQYFVFMIPVAAELDLKRAAKSAGVKSVQMIHVDEINRVTGYIRGGCSPIGMKKQYPTVIDESCLQHKTIFFSGGRIGTQIEASPIDLIRLIRAKTAKIVTD